MRVGCLVPFLSPRILHLPRVAVHPLDLLSEQADPQSPHGFLCSPDSLQKYFLAAFLLRILYYGLPDGIFQKRSTNRSRILFMLNLLNLPLISLLDLSNLEKVEAADAEEENIIFVIRCMFHPMGSAVLALRCAVASIVDTLFSSRTLRIPIIRGSFLGSTSLRSSATVFSA